LVQAWEGHFLFPSKPGLLTMKNKFPLMIAVVIGVAALFAINQYVKKMQQQAADQLKGQIVVAANVDIPAGTVLTVQMLGPKEVPPQFIPSQAIQGSDSVKQILGTKTSVAIHAGQMVLWSDLVNETHGGLAAIIPEGEGAFTVSIDKGVKPGLIQPNDHIDLIGSFAVPKPSQPLPTTAATAATWRQGSDVVNVCLLQNVQVLAVGDAFGGGVRSQSDAGGGLTLALTLAEAQMLMFAEQNGTLGAVLRRDGATGVVARGDLPRVTFDAIDKIIGDLDGKRAFRTVEVQKGSSTESVPVSNQSP
jgi:Flp pilus assembly protein CpaB